MRLQSDTVYCPLMLLAPKSKTGLSFEKIMPLCYPTQMQVILLCACRCVYLVHYGSLSCLKFDIVHCLSLRLPGTAKFCHLESVT